MGSRMARIKNGSQQQTNAPVMMASVLAAFRSRFESAEFEWVFLRWLDLTTGVEYVWPPTEVVSAVGGSFSIRSCGPLAWWLHFSGLVLADETFVKAVVVSLIVGRGRPIIVMTAAAMPPDPPAADAMSPPDAGAVPPT